MLIIPRRLARQPRGIARVDLSSPMAAGLHFALVPSFGRVNLARQIPSATDAAPPQYGSAAGLAARWGAGSVSTWVDRASTSPAATPRTVMAVVVSSGAIGTRSLFDNYFSTPNRITLRDVSGDYSFRVVTTGSVYEATGSGSGIALSTDGQLSVVFGVIHPQRWVYVWINGVSSFGATAKALPQLDLSGAPTVSVGDGGSILASAAWNRRLSDVEIISLSENPWQLFEPAQRRLWVGAAVAGGGAHLFRSSPGGSLSGLGSSGPFFQNPLQ